MTCGSIVMTLPSSSTGGAMSKTCRADAMLMNSPFSAKYRPGHALHTFRRLADVRIPRGRRKVKGSRHSPPSEAEAESYRVGCCAEVELSVANETFWPEHLRILKDVGVVHNGPAMISEIGSWA